MLCHVTLCYTALRWHLVTFSPAIFFGLTPFIILTASITSFTPGGGRWRARTCYQYNNKSTLLVQSTEVITKIVWFISYLHNISFVQRFETRQGSFLWKKWKNEILLSLTILQDGSTISVIHNKQLASYQSWKSLVQVSLSVISDGLGLGGFLCSFLFLSLHDNLGLIGNHLINHGNEKINYQQFSG